MPIGHAEREVPEDVHMSVPGVGPWLEGQRSRNQHRLVRRGVLVHEASVHPAVAAPPERPRCRDARDGHCGPHAADEVLDTGPMVHHDALETPAGDLRHNDVQSPIDHILQPRCLRLGPPGHVLPDAAVGAFPGKVPAVPEDPRDMMIVGVVEGKDGLVRLGAYAHERREGGERAGAGAPSLAHLDLLLVDVLADPVEVESVQPCTREC
mmetsp:Transcript_18793/g.59095  ORF Transcript_18793/g.59095 Transcript_18793/m.59095 type:complete len:209 (+) Transcript_18793:723-1349(+)